MGRSELERLSKEELIELVLRLQRPPKTSRTSSKPPSTDRKQQREKSKPGGAKPGHEGHSRTLSERVDRVVDHRPEQCPCCRAALGSDLTAEPVSVHERIELPEVTQRSSRRLRAIGAWLCAVRPAARGLSRQCRLAPRARRLDPACMRWQLTSRPFRRSLTSGCRPRSATCSGSPSARAVS